MADKLNKGGDGSDKGKAQASKRLRDKSKDELTQDIKVPLPGDSEREQIRKTKFNLRISHIMHERKVRERKARKR